MYCFKLFSSDSLNDYLVNQVNHGKNDSNNAIKNLKEGEIQELVKYTTKYYKTLKNKNA